MSSNDFRPDISVIICTQNRASSLELTLKHLAAADRDGIRAEVIVVDNAGKDNAREVVESFKELIPVRYLYEPMVGASGKSHALNRALDAGGLGEIIAIFDDDMSPHPDWFQAVMAICGRWPDEDIFTGVTYIVWPCDDIPDWAKKPSLKGGIFSSGSFGESDSPLRDGQWFSGNHLWFRSRVLEQRSRFKEVWLTEPDFQLDLIELGFRGVASPDAVAGHRVQPALLQRSFVLERVKKAGRSKALVRLQPYRKTVRQARMFYEHPLLTRLYCVLNYLRWRFLYFASYLSPSEGSGFALRLVAIERMTIASEYLRAVHRLEDYSVWKRVWPLMYFPRPGSRKAQPESGPASKH